FVAVGDGGRRITSTDGIRWTHDQKGGNNLSGITYGNGRFVAVGEGSRRIVSDDGQKWFNDQDDASGALYGVTWIYRNNETALSLTD
ncbi:MAG TPA: hypothetical protein VHY08_10120, partial [Bacillota bacterium]|nr:hypothetical protein [Bacillota bacterium]